MEGSEELSPNPETLESGQIMVMEQASLTNTDNMAYCRPPCLSFWRSSYRNFKLQNLG